MKQSVAGATGLLVLATIAVPPTALASALPDSISYTVFASGEENGSALIRVVERSPKLILESRTEVDLGHTIIYVDARTVANPETFEVEKFSWDRIRGDIADRGEFDMMQGRMQGWIEIDGERDVAEQDWRYDCHLTLEDYVFEHEILIARAAAVAGEKLNSCGMVFPSAKVTSPVRLGFVSEAEIESATRALQCRRLDVSITGATPYSLYFSPEMNLPVYMVFPAVGTEVFLDAFYGDRPISNWIPDESADSKSDG